MLAVDHGYFLGPTERLEDPARAVRPLVQHCDSLMLTRGVLRACVNPNSRVPVVLRVSGGPSIIGEDLSDEQVTVGIRDALRLGASALAMSVFVGARHERQTVVNLGRLVDEAEEFGVPVLAVTAVGKDMARDARYLSLACRMAAEQGARIVKTYYCEGFERVVESCPVPVIIAGGKKIGEREALGLTASAVAAGAVGVDMGRNIWQSDHPVAMIRAVRSIVHEGRTAAESYSLYGQLVRDEKGAGRGGAAPRRGRGRQQQGRQGSSPPASRKGSGRPQGQQQGQAQQRPQGQAQQRPQGQAQQRPQGQAQQRPQGQRQGQAQQRPQGQRQGQAQAPQPSSSSSANANPIEPQQQGQAPAPQPSSPPSRPPQQQAQRRPDPAQRPQPDQQKEQGERRQDSQGGDQQNAHDGEQKDLVEPTAGGKSQEGQEGGNDQNAGASDGGETQQN